MGLSNFHDTTKEIFSFLIQHMSFWRHNCKKSLIPRMTEFIYEVHWNLMIIDLSRNYEHLQEPRLQKSVI